MAWQPAYVALGSNLDEPQRQVETAFGALSAIAHTRLVARSGLWRSAPMGPKDQPSFVNAVAGLLTTMPAQEFLAVLAGIEARMGRKPPPVRWGPRIIDLDLLMHGETLSDDPELRLPHPGLHQRNFVLYPLAEIAPSLWVPGRGRVRTLCASMKGEGLERLAARVSGD